MNTDAKRKLLLAQLNETLTTLDRALDALRYSFAGCSAIAKKANFSIDEQEKFEALTARFARTADILTQKIFKTIFSLVAENPRTFIDAANLAEKMELIESADDILNIRELRNQIAHEYVIDDLKTIFQEVLQYTPKLEDIIEKSKKYIEENIS